MLNQEILKMDVNRTTSLKYFIYFDTLCNFICLFYLFFFASLLNPHFLLIPRRLFQMGIHTAEIFTNMGLCCFYAQHLDMALSCFQRALGVASDELLADIWYNIGHVALVRDYVLFIRAYLIHYKHIPGIPVHQKLIMWLFICFKYSGTLRI